MSEPADPNTEAAHDGCGTCSKISSGNTPAALRFPHAVAEEITRESPDKKKGWGLIALHKLIAQVVARRDAEWQEVVANIPSIKLLNDRVKADDAKWDARKKEALDRVDERS